ncbi:hypothetical protein AC1031_017495 [Aphanomyces cochlioides]|nr:hypothetical protein AC1031_017495 [Aphanomyces cochlioides]
MTPPSMVVLLIAAMLATANRLQATRDVKFVDTFQAIDSYEKQFPDVAEVHEQVRRALMEGTEEVMSPMENAEKKYKELKMVRAQIELAIAHCKDEECIREDHACAVQRIRDEGKYKGGFPPAENFFRKESFPLREFPSPNEFELERPAQQTSHHHHSHHEDNDEEEEEEDEEFDESDDPDFVDEFAYDRKQKQKKGTARNFPSQDEIEEHIRRQIKAHLMEMEKDTAQDSRVCIPMTGICDFNIILAVVWTALVALVVSVLSQSKAKTTARPPVKSKKKKTH